MDATQKKPPLQDPGDYHFVEERIRNEQDQVSYAVVGMVYNCPCGCNEISRLNFRSNARVKHNWDGNSTTPSVEPATPKLACGHSYWLQNGVFTEVTEY